MHTQLCTSHSYLSQYPYIAELVIWAGNFCICNLLLQNFKNSEFTTTLCIFLCFSIVVGNSCAYSQRMVNILKTTNFSMQRHSFIKTSGSESRGQEAVCIYVSSGLRERIFLGPLST